MDQKQIVSTSVIYMGRKSFEVIEKVCGLLKFKNLESERGLMKLAPTLQLQPAQGIEIGSDVVKIVFNPAYLKISVDGNNITVVEQRKDESLD